MATDKPLLNFLIDPELLQRLDNWRYKNHFPTRAAAIKWLLEFALTQKPRPSEMTEIEVGDSDVTRGGGRRRR